MDKNILLLDGNSLVNRAYYAIQRPMITRDGIYTQGIFGFLNMLQKLEKDYEPGYIAVCFDLKAPTFRHKEYAGYKAGRKKMPPELAMEIPILKDILRAMNIRIVEEEGWEADDFLGTLSLLAEEKGLFPLIVTGDKDSFQLASDRTTVVYTKRGVSEFELYDAAKMQERYGLTPAQFIDLKGLMGDSSDNLPGIPGVGEKTALPLLQKYGSLEELIAHAEEIPREGLRRKVIDSADSARMTKHLATIVRSIPGDWDFETMRYREPDMDKLIGLYTKLEFNSFLRRLAGGEAGGEKTFSNGKPKAKRETTDANPFGDAEPGLGGICKEEDGTENASGSFAVPALPEHPARRLVFTDEEGTGGVLRAIKDASEKERPVFLFVDSDENHLDIPSVPGLGILIGDSFYFARNAIPEILTGLRETNAKLTGHRLKDSYYPVYALYPEFRNWIPNTAFDTEIAAYLLNPNSGKYDLDTLFFSEFHRLPEMPEEERGEVPLQTDLFGLISSQKEETVPEKERTRKNADSILRKLEATEGLMLLYEKRLEAEGLTKVFTECELPLVSVMASMESEGFRMEPGTLLEAGKELEGRILVLQKRIYELAGEEFNIASPKQLGVVLFEKLMLPAGKKNKNGYSTSAEVLESLLDQHPIIGEILEYRTLSKLKSTYIEGMLPLIGTDGRVHAHFQQTVTATGRISCTEPNLQNIPVRYEEGKRLRKAFVPNGKDEILVGADYSQIELRVLASLSGDASLQKAFSDGEDIHRSTAAKVLGKKQEEITPEERSSAKAINFGLIYGKTGFGLAKDLHISVRAAEEYITNYFATYPTIREYLDSLKTAAKETGYATTLLGRKRPIPEINASAYMVRQLGERLAMNSPIQGTAADIIKLAMIRVDRALKEGNYRARLILQVHDELILSCPEAELEAVKELLISNMENAVSLSVRMKAELETGENWYQV